MSVRQRPNIILIMTDQQRFDTIGALGFPHMRTPALDRLVTEGVALEQCFCTAPSCVPSRASFFNLRYPHDLRVYRNTDSWTHSWAEHLQEIGYHTVNIGKMHTLPMDAPCGFDQRFVVENKDRPLRLDALHGNFYDEWDRFLNHSGVRKPSRHTYRAEVADFERALGAFSWPLAERYHPDVFVGAMAEWFLAQRRSTAPLFLQIGFPGPHPPYDPPDRVLASYENVRLPLPETDADEWARQPPPQADYRREMTQNFHDGVCWRDQPDPEQLLRLRRHYAANISLIDERIGRILTSLEQRGYLDDAIVVFLSDHGDCLGDHGHIQKWTMFDAVTRVPAIVWAPGRLTPGSRIGALVQPMDVAAAVLDMAGVPRPSLPPDVPDPLGATMSGAVSFDPVAVLRGDHPGRHAVFAEHAADNILKSVSFVTMVRTRDWKLVHYLDQPWGEFYDLERDPGERCNRWDDPVCTTEKQKLLDLLRDWRIRGTL